MIFLRSSKLLLLVLAIFVIGLLSIPVSARENVAPDAVVLREGNDFATLELREPRDMDTFGDVSQWINHAGTSNYITNITFEDGVFSGKTNGDYSEFYMLFPGYEPGVNQPGTGVLTPISSSKYQCFYLAMKVDIPESTEYFWNVGWVEDQTLDWGGGASGKTYGNKVVNNQWMLYQLAGDSPDFDTNLKNWPYQAGDRWGSLNYWQGFRITPIMKRPNTTFHVDWVRLTDCKPVNHNLVNLPADTDSIWLGIGSPERKILVASGLFPTNGQYTMDVQGVQPGTYSIYVKKIGGDKFVGHGSLTIEPAPIPTFSNPSPIIGQDYATLAGNPWDMRDNQDVIWAHCTNDTIRNDILFLETLPPSKLPNECVGGGANEADPKVYLNTPVADDITEYRYLSFRHKIDGPWAQPSKGMIVRWIWEMGGLAPKDCKYVSREIALDVGWHTYWVDLYDPWNGTPAEVGGLNASKCPFPVQWKSQPGVLSQFRLDPNENILATTMYQAFDWIRLIKAPSVQQGGIFPVQVSLNISVEKIRSINFYYTNDIKRPTKYKADGSTAGQNALQDDQVDQVDPWSEITNPIFVPLVFNRFTPPVELPQVENEIRFHWNTGSVAPGEYYICAVTSDGYNQTTFCSQAPVKVKP